MQKYNKDFSDIMLKGLLTLYGILHIHLLYFSIEKLCQLHLLTSCSAYNAAINISVLLAFYNLKIIKNNFINDVFS